LSNRVFLTPNNISNKYLDKSKSEIPIYRQCELLGISKSAAYYDPVPVSSEDLILMKFIDKNHTDFPSYGTRTMSHQLTLDVGYQVGRKRTGTLINLINKMLILLFTTRPIFFYFRNNLLSIWIPRHILRLYHIASISIFFRIPGNT